MLTFPILLVLMVLVQSPVVSTDPGAVRGPAVTSTDPGAVRAPVLQDDAWGECPAFSHYHSFEPASGDSRLDGKCHADIDDSPLGDRKVLPNPKDLWL
jgi:hypothetical protein